MEKMKLYAKKIAEEDLQIQLEYFLLVHSAEKGNIYGVMIEKTDEAGNKEQECVVGLCETKEEAEYFLNKLAEGNVFPVHLMELCDDYISEKESEKKYKKVQAAS